MAVNVNVSINAGLEKLDVYDFKNLLDEVKAYEQREVKLSNEQIERKIQLIARELEISRAIDESPNELLERILIRVQQLETTDKVAILKELQHLEKQQQSDWQALREIAQELGINEPNHSISTIISKIKAEIRRLKNASL